MPETRSATETVEPYKLSEIFSIVPEYDGNSIFLNTFISSCTTAQSMAVGNQSTLLVLHIKNKLRGRAAELVNSRDPSSWDEIRDLLENHFGDSRDLSALIQDLQRMRQMPNESPLTFAARLQTHEAKMHAAVNKQNLTAKEKSAQIALIESMALNSLLTGVEPRIGQILRASDPDDIVTAISRIRRELQLHHLETQKFSNSRTGPTQIRKPPTPTTPIKQCTFCKRTGHSFNECMTRQRQFQQPPNNTNNFRPHPFPQNNQSNGYGQRNVPQHNRPPQNGAHMAASGSNNNNNNNNGNRPPNFFRNQRTHHFNETNHNNSYDYDDYDYDYDSGYETMNNQNYEEHYDNYDSTCYPGTSNDYPENYQSPSQQFQDSNKNFHARPPQAAPPDHQVDNLQSQIQTMNLEDSFNPNLNFPEQGFL